MFRKKIKPFLITLGFVRVFLILAIVTAVILQSWISVLISAITLTLSYLPNWIERKTKINLPLDFQVIIIFFVFATLFLGEISKFYEFFWWWDILLHGISAQAFGCIGFIIMFYLYQSNRLATKPFWLSIFAFAFAISIGVVWEIFEFSMDQLFGFNMQKSGLVDTMWDLIVNSIGGLTAALAGYAYLRGEQKSYLSRMIAKFIKQNPDLNV